MGVGGKASSGRAGDEKLLLAKPPIVEAVLDLDCDLPPGRKITELEAVAREKLGGRYPKARRTFIQEHQIEAVGEDPPKLSVRRGIQALQFLHDDEKQLIQFRPQGFSFNRLAPYSTLDDYLPEIERTWRVFVKIASPLQVRIVRLRYINRILLPTREGRVELNEFFTFRPQLPQEERLRLRGFFNQYNAVEIETGNEVNVVMTPQEGEGDWLPIVLDLTAGKGAVMEPANWEGIVSCIESLRSLNNRIFRNTLTQKCLNLFQK